MKNLWVFLGVAVFSWLSLAKSPVSHKPRGASPGAENPKLPESSPNLLTEEMLHGGTLLFNSGGEAAVQDKHLKIPPAPVGMSTPMQFYNMRLKCRVDVIAFDKDHKPIVPVGSLDPNYKDVNVSSDNDLQNRTSEFAKECIKEKKSDGSIDEEKMKHPEASGFMVLAYMEAQELG